MYGCESWTTKKAECRRTDAFELWCWRRLLGVPWTARQSNHSALEVINPEYSLEGLMLKLKLQYFGHLMQRADSLEKTLMLGKIEGRRRRGWQRIRRLDGIIDSVDMNLSKVQEMVKDREAWHFVVHGVAKSRTHLSNLTATPRTSQNQWAFGIPYTFPVLLVRFTDCCNFFFWRGSGWVVGRPIRQLFLQEQTTVSQMKVSNAEKSRSCGLDERSAPVVTILNRGSDWWGQKIQKLLSGYCL